MSEFKYPNLFTPIQLGNALFRNRIFAAPTGWQDMDIEGMLPAEAAFYYERKASGGAASVAVGECVVDSTLGRGAEYHICLDNPHSKIGLARIASAVKRQGAVTTAELQHAGMYANRMQDIPGIAYGPVDYDDNGRKVLAMTDEIIEHTIKKYVDGALFAKLCGFGMVTVHAGHGWLLSQFLSPSLNTRHDKWGGSSIENRARLTVAVLDAIRAALGRAFPIEVRISGSEVYDGGYGIDEGVAFAKQIDGHCDLIHVSAGSHEVDEVFTVTHPSMFLEDGVNVKYAAEVKKHVKTPVATVGALVDPELMEEIIASGRADVVEIARGLLADPDIPTKARSGHQTEIRKCMRCLTCFAELMNIGQFYCSINPESGREMEMKFDIPPVSQKKVLVVGGGIAGMQAALTCSKRGHDVILCEKSGRLGGTLLCEENVPFKAKLAEYIKYQSDAIARSGVDLRLNTEVNAGYAEGLGVDVIIAALGARPAVPPITGIDGSNVLSAEDAYVNPDKVGQNVAILGAGLVGVELALYLSILGRKVTIIEMLADMSDGGSRMHRKALDVEIARYKIDIHYNTKALKIDGAGVTGESVDGTNATSHFDADTVIYASGQRPLREEGMALRYSAPLFYQIGDCDTPRNILAATSVAHEISRNIGRADV
jgi:2,4-dienoyl-CoA reductase-like NADH-dependent reductase (Old Yellow Enzyme family)/thioredoxin reductase